MYFVGINIGIDKTTVSRSPGYNGAAVSQIALKNVRRPEVKSIDTAICKNDGEWSLGSIRYNVINNFFGCPWKMTVKESEPMREFANLIFNAILQHDSDLFYNQTSKEKNFVLGITIPSDWVRYSLDAEQQYINFFKYECGLPVDCCMSRSNAIYNSRYNEFNINDSVLIIDIESGTIDFSTYVKSKCVQACCWGGNVGTQKIVDILITRILQYGNNAQNLRKLKEFRNSKGLHGDVLAVLSLFVQVQVETYFIEKHDAFVLLIPYIELTQSWPGAPWDLCIEFEASREEFNEIIAEYIATVNNTLVNAKIKLNQNGIAPNKVILSGNTAGVIFIREYAWRVFDVKPNINCDSEFDASSGISVWMSNNYKHQNIRERVCAVPNPSITLVIDVDWIGLNFYTNLGYGYDRELSWNTNLGAHLINDILSREIFNKNSNKNLIEHIRQIGLSGDINLEPIIQQELKDYYLGNKDVFQIHAECRMLVPQWPGSNRDCIDFSVTQEEYEQLISSYKKVVEYELLKAKYKFEQRGVDIEQVLVQGNWKFINFIKDYIKDIFKINVEDSIV